jgi:hypothetical protein
MTIEIVVGLPHLNNGPILARAKAMQQPMQISANCLSKWRERGGWRSWEGWRLSQLDNATELHSLDLDSAGYVLTSLYRGFPWSIADYMALAASYPFRRIAAADYCCEHEIAGNRDEVLDQPDNRNQPGTQGPCGRLGFNRTPDARPARSDTGGLWPLRRGPVPLDAARDRGRDRQHVQARYPRT